MTPRSDHDDDMSMEEILASIRKFVTDNPPEEPNKQSVYKGDLTESVVIPPQGHMMNREQAPPIPQTQPYELATENSSVSPSQPQWQPSNHTQGHDQKPPVGYMPVGDVRGSQPMHRQAATAPTYEPDILELNSPISSKGMNQRPGAAWSTSRTPVKNESEDSIMTLINPIDSKRTDKPTRFSSKLSTVTEREEGLGSAHALAASASSLSRLAQASKSAPKRSPNLADQRDLSLDQLVQDLIRPMIKQWIDTHLSSLVEEMVAKEIKRITKHLG